MPPPSWNCTTKDQKATVTFYEPGHNMNFQIKATKGTQPVTAFFKKGASGFVMSSQGLMFQYMGVQGEDFSTGKRRLQTALSLSIYIEKYKKEGHSRTYEADLSYTVDLERVAKNLKATCRFQPISEANHIPLRAKK